MADKKPRTIEINIDDLKPVKNTKLTLDELSSIAAKPPKPASHTFVRLRDGSWQEDWDAPF